MGPMNPQNAPRDPSRPALPSLVILQTPVSAPAEYKRHQVVCLPSPQRRGAPQTTDQQTHSIQERAACSQCSRPMSQPLRSFMTGELKKHFHINQGSNLWAVILPPLHKGVKILLSTPHSERKLPPALQGRMEPWWVILDPPKLTFLHCRAQSFPGGQLGCGAQV